MISNKKLKIPSDTETIYLSLRLGCILSSSTNLSARRCISALGVVTVVMEQTQPTLGVCYHGNCRGLYYQGNKIFIWVWNLMYFSHFYKYFSNRLYFSFRGCCNDSCCGPRHCWHWGCVSMETVEDCITRVLKIYLNWRLTWLYFIQFYKYISKRLYFSFGRRCYCSCCGPWHRWHWGWVCNRGNCRGLYYRRTWWALWHTGQILQWNLWSWSTVT